MLSVAAVALLIESIFGYPAWVFRLIGHPVVWIGRLIERLDRVLNPPSGLRTVGRMRARLNGTLAILAIVALPVGGVLLAQAGLGGWPRWARSVVLGIVASSLLAQRSLHAHVRAVADGLRTGGLAGGRAAVAHIVGRDTAALDEAGIVRAAIESLAENFSDGVVAPLFWCTAFGLPGIVAYKAINTADSMIGHRSPRYRDFGCPAARLDDLVNLPASRLAALWIVLAASLTGPAAAWRGVRIVRRDARRHRSPNAGWPEAAMAGVLAIRLAGPRSYGGAAIADGWIGDGDRAASASDLTRALRLYRRACAVQLVLLMVLAFSLRSG